LISLPVEKYHVEHNGYCVHHENVQDRICWDLAVFCGADTDPAQDTGRNQDAIKSKYSISLSSFCCRLGKESSNKIKIKNQEQKKCPTTIRDLMISRTYV
jgi:hypothetical protein